MLAYAYSVLQKITAAQLFGNERPESAISGPWNRTSGMTAWPPKAAGIIKWQPGRSRHPEILAGYNLVVSDELCRVLFEISFQGVLGRP